MNMEKDIRVIYQYLEKFFLSSSNIGHFERAKSWKDVNDLKDIFENQEHIRDEIVNYINIYFPSFFKRKPFFLLDVGCSIGALTFAFRDYVDYALGIDIEKEAVDCAKAYQSYKGYKNIDFIIDDATSMVKVKEIVQNQGKKFDLVLAKDVIEHLGSFENTRNFLLSLREVLEDEAILFIEVPNYIFPLEPHLNIPIFPLIMPKFLIKLEAKMFGKLKTVHDEAFIDHLNLISPFKLRRLLEEHGFCCFNPVEEFKIPMILSGKRQLAEKYRPFQKVINILEKMKLSPALQHLLSSFKLYPTLQQICIYKKPCAEY